MNLDWTQIIVASIGTVGLLFGGGILGRLIFSPKEKAEHENITKQVEATVSETILNIAKGTVEVATGVTDELEAQFKRMSADARDERAEHQKELVVERQKAAEFRAELDAATEDLRKLRQQLKQAADDLESCRKRCIALEAQLAARD